MNFLIRTYAWMTILQDTGIFNNFLHPAPPAQHHHHRHGGRRHHRHGHMTTSLHDSPLYSIMAKMDERLIEAARDLGATVFGVPRQVILAPLSLPWVSPASPWC